VTGSRNDLRFRLGRALEVLGLLLAAGAVVYGMTASEDSPALTIEFTGLGLGLCVFYFGRSLVSRSIHE
jgi:hypothetical protein